MKKSAKKKIIIIAGIVAVVLAAVIVCLLIFGKGKAGGETYVTKVSTLMGTDISSANRFTGVVQTAQTVEYKLDSTKTLKETYVQEGDEVKAGDVLFSYDSEVMEMELAQIDIDIQKLNADIASNNEFIAQLQEEKQSAPEDEQLSYSLQIQQYQNDNQSIQYQIKTKNNERTQKENDINNANVKATSAGMVKKINTDAEAQYYISIVEAGEYTVLGTVNETNLWQVTEGANVVVYSRIDDQTWTGVISKVDKTAEETDTSKYYSDSSSSGSSSYNFTVKLDSSNGLFLGQHVTIGIGGEGPAKSGLWLYDFYIVDADTDAPYVWVGKNGKLKMQPVTLGEYDAEYGMYEIKDGLEADSEVAFPEEGLKEGMSVISN